MKPLKVAALLSWTVLFLCQLGLLWHRIAIDIYWVVLLSLPLLLPLKGLVCDQRYTYKWVGFMTLVYFCVGISELVANPELRIYGFVTTISSTLLFLTSIYYARYLAIRASQGTVPPGPV